MSRFSPRSLKVRLSVAVTGLAILLIALVSFVQGEGLRADLGATVVAQQDRMLDSIAEELDAKLGSHLKSLERSASALPLATASNAEAFRAYYAARPAMLVIFDDLVFADREGRLVADHPRLEGRTKVSVADRSEFKRVMRTGETLISEPLLGRTSGKPMVIMNAPVRDAEGRIAGVLSGVLHLDRPNVLGNFATRRFGETGYVFMLTRGTEPVYISHPDAARLMQPRPANKAEPTTRALAGDERSGEGVNSRGERVLYSFHSLKTTKWLIGAALPVDEAYAPIARAERRLLVVACLIALVVAPLVWTLAWRMFRPLSALVDTIDGQRASGAERFGGSELERLSRSFHALMAERDALEERLRAREAEVRTITDNLPALVCYIDRDHVFRFNNRNYSVWLDRPMHEITGRPVAEVYGVAIHARLAPAIDAALAGHTRKFEVDFQGRDGKRHHVRGTYRPDVGADGAVRGVYGHIVDVTRLKEAEAALVAERDRMSRTGRLAGVGGWELDLRTRVATWSDETCRLHDVEPGYSPPLDEAIAFYTPESRPLIAAAVEAGIADGQDWDLELELVSARGRRFWARAVGTVEFEGGVPARLVGAFQDITERKRIELALAESRELLEVTFDSIGDAVITTDVDGRVQWMNPVAERMTGWSRVDARGRPAREVFVIVHEDSRAAVPDPVAACMARGKVVGLAERTVLVARDGREYGIEDSASPIRDGDGHLYGAVLVFHDVSEQRRMSREMTHRATHDALTDLPNRSEFESRLKRVLHAAGATENALLFIDLDQFKVVNDTCGHAVGDQLLRQVASLFKAAVRGRDTVARLGGDEFGILLEHCTVEQAARIAQKVCDQMEEFRFAHDDRRFRVGASIGLVAFDARWPDIARAMQAADAACYAAKDAGRNRVHVWLDTDEAMKARHGETQWVARLERALDENRFTLFGQRIVAIEGLGGEEEAPLHVEVLLRLREEDGRIVPPGAFLPAAERFHMAARIDRWVVRKVIESFERNPEFAKHVGLVAVNLSGLSIGDRAFHRDVLESIRAASFDPTKLCFEITETAAITNLDDARAFIVEARSLGVKIALDDFGAGASSFAYLKSLPVDFLKIDGQFITSLLDDPLDQAAVRCFSDVAKTMGLKTIAEFVERDETREALRAMGIDMAQGFLIHHPEPMDELAVTAI